MVTVETPRMLLRNWKDEDRQPFSQLNADPVAMEYFEKLLSREESDAMIERIHQHDRDKGFGLWAMELKSTGEFMGMTGLWKPQFEAHFTPCVEVGWRMSPKFWGFGYATEAAQASIDYGFNTLNLEEIVAMTVPLNKRSRAVMDRLGMIYDPTADFDHPKVSDGHKYKRHVLYRLKRTKK